jgi:YVTN family beta-propeller protein
MVRRRALAIATTAAAMLAGAPVAAADQSGPVTPAGFQVAPVGREFGVSKLATGFQGPMGAALSPDGTRLLAASSGASRSQSADLFDIDAGVRTDALYYQANLAPGESVFYGVAWAPDGTRAWVAGGGQRVVHALRVDGDRLEDVGTIPTPGFAAGLAYGVTPRGPRLYVVNNTVPPLASNTPGRQVTVIDPATGTVTGQIDLGMAAQPLGVAFARDGRTAIVTNWIGRSVSVIDTETEIASAPVTLSPDPLRADHPSAVVASPARDEAYVANANSDTVSVVDSRSGAVLETIAVGLVPGGPKGASPVGLAVAPDGGTLYVTLAGENAVAVVDLATRTVRGVIPSSWYPADVKVTADGGRLVITNTNDSGAGPNRCGPTSPLPECAGTDPETQYSGRMIKGSVQVVNVPGSPRTLQAYTDKVKRNDQVQARAQTKPPALSAIKHVFYVIKENRTYDQVFGDLPGGNGDPALTVFNDDSAPNHHALARRFGIYDNFYADAEVSADGHNWSTQANATDYVDKTWPFNYSPSLRNGQRGYDFEDPALQYPAEFLASDPSVLRSAAAQTVGYLWDNAWAHGISYRDYGEYTAIPGDCSQPPESRSNTSQTTHLQQRFGSPVATSYPGYNLACSDHLDREPEWEKEFRELERDGSLPALNLIRLPSDHTRGTTAGAATPPAYMADNDLALGRIVDVISHSRYWEDSVILVTEDDAQNGPDHVDAHRTVALVISPFNQRGGTDSTHYDTASMVATAEELLGLPPMSIVDQRVSRMWKLFRDQPDPTPYQALQPAVVPFGEPDAPVNGPNAPMAAESATWDFSRQDATPEVALNEAIWKSVNGPNSRMPRPRHVKIIGSRPNDEDD